MGEVIISASGPQYGMVVNSDGSINTSATSSVATEVTPSGTGFNDFTLRYIQRIDYQNEMQPVYIGLAEPGTNSGSSSWQIRKYSFSGAPSMVTAVLFGSGTTAFDKVWNNRSGTNEVYS